VERRGGSRTSDVSDMTGMAGPMPFFSTSTATMIAMMLAMMLPNALQQSKRRGIAFGAGYLCAWAAVGAVVAVVPVVAGLATVAGISFVACRINA
jgi:hypothetical protein